MAHAQRRTIRPYPGLFDLLARACPATSGEPAWIDDFRARDQVFELLVGLAEEDAVPVLAVGPGYVLAEVAEEKVALATEDRPTEEEFVYVIQLNGR